MADADRDFDLMRLHDDELDPADDGLRRRELEVALAGDPALAGKRAALGELSELVRGHLELAADAAEPRLDAMWREVEKRIELDRKAAAAPVVTRAASAEPAPAGLLARLGRWFERTRGHILTGAVSAGAVAALALVLRAGEEVPPVGPGPVAGTELAGHGVGPGPGPGAGPIVAQPVLQPSAPEIESLDVAEGTGTVMTIEDEDGETAVIWVTPEDTVEGL